MTCLLNLLLGFFILLSPVFAQENSRQNDLDIKIKTSRAVYRIGDAFVVYGTIRNLSDKSFYYNPDTGFLGFSANPIVFDGKRKPQRKFLASFAQIIGSPSEPKLLIGPKGTYKFSIHGIIEKGEAVLSQDKNGENAIKAFGIIINFRNLERNNILLSGPGKYFLKVSCALGTDNSRSYIHTDNYVSSEAEFNIRDEKSSEPVNVQKDIKTAIREEDYLGGYQDILYDFSKEGNSLNAIKDKNEKLYREKYAKLVDKYLEIVSRYMDEVSQKLPWDHEGRHPELDSFLMKGSATKNVILFSYRVVDPEAAGSKSPEIMKQSIKNTADMMLGEIQSRIKDKAQNQQPK